MLKPYDARQGAYYDDFEIRELDLATGEYTTLYKLDFLGDLGFGRNAFVNAAAMLDAGTSGYFVVVAIACKLCRLAAHEGHRRHCCRVREQRPHALATTQAQRRHSAPKALMPGSDSKL